MRRGWLCAVVGVLGCAVSLLTPASVGASATPVGTPSTTQGFGLDDLHLVGVADRRPTGWIRLTGTNQIYVVGAAYTPDPLTVDNLTVRMRFRVFGDCADGLAVVIQGEGPDAIGAFGEDMGYGLNKRSAPGVTHSIAIEADLYRNSGKDEPIPSLGLQSRGAEENDGDPAYSLGSHGVDELLSDAVHRLKVEYHDNTMGVFLDGKRHLHKTVDLDALLGLAEGTAYVGVSSGSGICTPTVSIRAFTVTS